MNKKPNMVYGIRAVIEAIRAGQHLERTFIQKNLKGEGVKELTHQVHRSKTPLSKVPIARIHTFTKKNHQGVVAFISPVQYHNLNQLVPGLYEKGELPLILVLDEITDVGNFGAIARTAEGMGAHGIVIPVKGAAQISEDAIKTSAGALHYLPICREKSLVEAVIYLKESGIQLISCSEKGDKKVDEMDYTRPSAIIVGSEEKGIKDEILKQSDAVAKVPTKGNIQSLNVSVVAGMMLYEAQRQRN